MRQRKVLSGRRGSSAHASLLLRSVPYLALLLIAIVASANYHLLKQHRDGDESSAIAIGTLSSELKSHHNKESNSTIESFVIGFSKERFNKFLDANDQMDDTNWFPSINGWTQSVADDFRELTGGGSYINVSSYKPFEKDQFGPNAAGCYMSHYYLLKSIRSKKSSTGAYVVFEDDARCITGWQEEIVKVLGSLPIDWDILFFGGRPISYFHQFHPNDKPSSSLRHDICSGMFGKANGPLAPDGSRNISRSNPYWRAMYHIHTHAYVVNPGRIERVLAVLEERGGHEPVDQRLANAMASESLIAYMTSENMCEQSRLMSTYTPSWDGKTPQPWMGHFGFSETAVHQHPGILESHMWGKIALDKHDSPSCQGVY